MYRIDIEEEATIIAATKEDLHEFEKLYGLYFCKVYAYFISRVGDTETAEDLTSQTFLKALENFQNYEFTGKPFGVWLFRIAHNLRIDYYRKNNTAAVDLEEASDLASSENITEQVHTKLLSEKIHQLLKKFSAEEQEIILLKLSSGLKFSEIAKIIGKNESTVKTKYFRTLKNLKGKADMLIVLIALLEITAGFSLLLQ